MSEFDITPNFTSDIPDVGGMVPGEFEAPEAAIDRMVGKPEPTPSRLRTPMNPEGRAPRDGMGFRENVSGAFRSGTLAGVIAEAAQQEDAASGGAQSARGGFSPAQLAQMPSSVRARLEARDPAAVEQSARDAEDAVYSQVAYDNSQANLSGASVAGTLVGSLASPESLGGISGLLVKQFRGLAARPILTAGIDAAVVNTATDPVVQGARMASGAQENFDPAQTAMAPVVGFALGSAVRGAMELPSMARERSARQAAGQPEPLVEPTQAAPVAAAPEPTPVRETPPAATPEPARPVAAAEQPRDPIAAAVDEALPELREAPAPVAREAAAAGAPAALLGEAAPKIAPHKVATPDGRAIDVTPIVIEARSLRTSADEGYDAALQPRDRDRAASQAQIREMATALDPQRLGYSAEADRGAPIVGGDGMVESGNGRIMAIRRAYDQSGEAAASYRAWVAEQGVDVSGFREPVLVRQNMTPMTAQERQQFTVAANQASTLSMSAGERAMADARAISPQMLDLIRNPDDLGALGNVDFVKAFVRGLPQTEQGALVRADGSFAAEGMSRIRNAVLARAYGDSTVLARVAEATSDDIKSISNALVSAAPEWAKLRADVDAGSVRADVDFTTELLEAVTRTADLRGKGLNLETFLAQQDAFDRISSPVEGFMRWFYDASGRKAAGAPNIAEKLKFYAQEARKVSAGDGLDLGLAPVSARDIQALAAQRGSNRGQAGASEDLFASSGTGVRQGERVGNADAARSVADSSGEGSGGARAGNDQGGQGRGGVAPEGNVSPALAEMRRDPASWVIREKETGAVVMETFDRAKVDALNTAKYEAVPIIDHLASLNKKPKAELTVPEAELLFRREPSAATDTPAFKKWFGKSKVVDVGGKPLKLYKASPTRTGGPVRNYKGDILEDAPWRDITSFDSPGNPYAGFFTDDPAVANRFADAFMRAVGPENPTGMFAVYAKIERPFIIDVQGKPAASVQFKSARDGWDDTAYRAALADKKYDGVILLNTKDEGNVYIPKEPTQVKSAIGNTGEFDGSNPDILLRKGSRAPAQPLPPNQVMAGRPLADQAAPRPTEPVRLVRIEEISRGLVEAFQALGREGRVMPGAQGQYSTRSGVIRVKSIADLDTVAHEVGHSFHLHDAKADIDGLIKVNRKELEPLGSGDKTGDMEAFAELFRLFTINRPFAERSYPNATAALDELMRSKFPDQYRALDELRAAMDDLHRAPSGEVVSADTIQTEPAKFGDGLREAIASDYDPSGRTLYSAFDRLYTSVIDKTHPVWKAVENLRAIGKANGKTLDVKPIDDAYILSRMMPGSHGSAGVMLEHGVIPAGGISPEGPSLGTAIEKALGKKWDEKGFADFGAYLTARRMVAEYARFFNGEIPNPPGKFSLADYQKAVAEFDTANPAFREAAEDVYGFLDNHLKRAYDKGLFSKEYYDASISRADYVPFVRDMADFAEPTSVGEGGAPKGLRFSLMKAFKGSQRSVQNPLESIFKRVHDLEFAIAQNDAIGALARLADAAGPGSGAIAERIPSNQLRGQRVDVVEALKAAGKAANIDDADLKALILQAEDQLGDSTWATLFKQEPIAPGREPIVFHWVNGERQALRLADGRFGTELFHALNAMSDVEKNWFASILQISQQILRSGVTKAPDFILTNFIRDQFTATATSGRRYIPFISALRGVVDAITKTDDAVTYAGMGGMAGGAIADVIDRASFGRNVRGLENASVIRNVMAGDILGAGGALLRTSAKALELSEAGTRMGLYKSYFEQAKGMGFDDLNAATFATFKATDYIDFRKAGASMGWLRRWVPFLNAALQGTDKEFRAIGDLPVLEAKRARGETLSSIELDRLKDARVAMIRVLSLGAIVGAGLAIKNADEPDYQNAPGFTKRGNFLFKVGDVWVAIPKPFGIVQSVVNAFETAADYSVRKDPSLWGDWLEGSAKGFVPPTNNPLVSLAYDLPANYNRFRESPIVPYYLQGVKPSEQYTIGTSELSKMIGQVTGWSPMKVEYAVSNLGGSSALNLLKTSDLLMGSDKPESQIYNWPVARRFVKNLVRGNQATTEFYKLVGDKTGKYEQSENAYRNKVRNGERANAAEFLRTLPEDERAWTVLQSQGFEATEKRLHPMQNAKDRISVIGGMTSQLNFNNLIKDADVDRQNTTISRRDAVPISLDKSTRAKLIENFQELQFISARNAMIMVGAKGTAGLKIIDDKAPLERIKAISPEAHAEYQARVAGKKIYEPSVAFQAWPEVKSRLLRDGENADLADLVPAGAKRKRKR